jgi:hypothetical protein
MATKQRAVPPGGGKRRPTQKVINTFVSAQTARAQQRNLGQTSPNSWDDFENEVLRVTLKAIDDAGPDGSWKALAKKRLGGRDFVELVPTLDPGMAPESPWNRRQIKESYGDARRLGLSDPDEERREAMGFFLMRGGHVRTWLVNHAGIASLQAPALFCGADYDDVEDADPSGAEAVADERSESETEAVDAQIDFGSLEWERLTPRQRIVSESIAYLGLQPFEIAQNLGVSKATISADMKAIRDWLIWHQTTPPTDPPDTPAAAAKDVA